MMKKVAANKKLIIFLVLTVAIISVVLVSVYFSKSINTENVAQVDSTEISAESGEYLNGKPISRLQGSFAIDVNNPRELVGDADYVFVAEVVSEDGTEYLFPIEVETDDGGTKVVTSPYTNYSIKVVEDIKGNLVTDTVIPIQKDGGLFEDGSMYQLYEDDELPVVGETYIFYAYAQEDGSLLISGPNSNVKMDMPNGTQLSDLEEEVVKEVLETSDEYIEVEEALDNQIVRDRERSESIYEEE